MLMKNSNQGKYGSLMIGLTTQSSLGTNQYPKDVMAAVDKLTNHRFDKNQRTTTKGTGIGTTTTQH
jgi:hypothetical protein